MLSGTDINEEISKKLKELNIYNLENLISELRKISLSENDSNINFILSCCYSAKQQKVLAFKHAKQSLERDPHNSKYWIRTFESAVELKNHPIVEQIIELAEKNVSPAIQKLALQFKDTQVTHRPENTQITRSYDAYFKIPIENALTQLKGLLQKNPYDASVLNAIGALLLKDNNISEARQYFHLALENNPLFAAAYNNIGILYEKQNTIDLARDNFLSSVFLAPQNAKYAANLANVEYKNKHYFEACYALEHLLELGAPEFNYFALAHSHQMQGNYDKAINYYQIWLEKYPEDASALGNIGVIYLLRGDMYNAISNLQKSVSFNPNSLTLLNSLGAAHLQVGDLTAAESVLEKAIKLEPKFTPAYTNLGLLHKAQGKTLEAIETLTLGIQHDPTAIDARYNLAITLHDTGELQKSITELQIVLNLKPDHAKALFAIGNNYLKLNSPKIATEFFETCLKFDPNNVDALNNLGNAFQDLGDTSKAIACYEKAINVRPLDMPAYRHLGLIKSLSSEQKIINFLEKQKSNNELTNNQKVHLFFALTKAYEEIKNFEASFDNLKNGNKLLKELSQYTIKTDQLNFKSLKKQAEKISTLKARKISIEHDLTPIFIVGMPRSGTTLIDRIISNHSDVTSLGELRYARFIGWSLSLGKLEATVENVAKFRLEYLKQLEFHAPNTNNFIDKMPHNFQMLPLLSKAFSNAHFVLVRRDKAATCWSNYRQYFSGAALAYSSNLDDIIGYYGLYEDLMSFYSSELGIRCTVVDYDKLVSDQENQIRSLLDNLNLRWEPNCLTPETNTSNVQTASQHQVRQKIYKNSSSNWKNYGKFLVDYPEFQIE